MDNKSDFGVELRFIRSFILPHWKVGITILCATLLSTGLRTVRPLLILFLIDDVFVCKNFTLLKGVAFLYFLNVAISYILLLLQDFWIEKTKQKIKFFILLGLFKHIQLLPISFFRDKESGYLSTRIISDTESLGNIFTDIFTNIATPFFTIIAIISITFAISEILALAMIILIPIYVLMTFLFLRRIRRVTNEVQEAQATMGNKYQEVFSSVYFIKSHGLENFFKLRIIKDLKALIKRSIVKEYLRAAIYDTTSLITALSTLAVIYILGIQIMHGRTSVGTVYVVIAYLNMIFSNIQSLIYTNTRIQQSIAIIKRIYHVLDTPVSGEYQCGLAPPVVKKVRYYNVTFAYDSKKEILKQINLIFNENEITALVGESGTGKTTIINLLLGLYDSYKGKIFLNNTELRRIDKRALRRMISLVPQEPFLFSTTIKENIKMGKPDASDKEIVESARLAYAHDFINNLPYRYETIVGEKGAKLSGGEKQRIALARAIIKNPKILIIDEGTSQIDSFSENLIQKSLQNLKRGRIIILVAHRLATILEADMIFVLDKGKIVAKGNHDYLLENCECYRHLFESQIEALTPKNLSKNQ